MRPAPDDAAGGYATVVDGAKFSWHGAPLAKASGIEPSGPLTVLGGPAVWIWDAAAQLPAAAQVLDIFLASEHLAPSARVLFGDADWAERGRRSVVADGWPGYHSTATG